MRTTSALVAVAATAAGTVGAAWAYDAAAPPEQPVPVASSSQAPAKVVAKRPRLVWAPCRPPAVLRAGACVTDRVRTVVLPPLPVPALPAAPQPATATRSDDGSGEPAAESRDDDGREQETENETENEVEHESEPPEPEEHEDP